MYAKLVNNLDELEFTDIEPYLSNYLAKVAKDGTSVLEALLHHSHVIKMVGPSYRIKDYCDLVDSE